MSTNTPVTGRIELPFDQSQGLPALLQTFLEEQPDKVALIEEGVQRTWSESIRRIYRMANGLLAVPGELLIFQ